MNRPDPQLCRRYGVLSVMSNVSHERMSVREDNRRGPQVVALPDPHEGVRRALLGSFGQIPAMPQEFSRLLDRLG
jgi:hypothetical protein